MGLSFPDGSEIRSSNITWSIANSSLVLSTIHENLSFQHTIVGIVFTAFSFESMINHYANMRIGNWNQVERRTPRDKKFKQVFDDLNISAFYSSGDFQQIKECLNIRDSLAHGKTFLVKPPKIDKSDIENIFENSHMNKFLFDNKITMSNLKCYIKAVRDLETLIEQTNPEFNQYPLSISGSTFI